MTAGSIRQASISAGAAASNFAVRFAARWENALPLLGLGVALLLGLYVRLYFVLQADFPLNDGGMFYVMARDIQAAGYALPAYTTYNHASIPFAYPPLPFYTAAVLDDLTPWSLTDVFRFVPLIVNLLTIVVVFQLARAMLSSKLTWVLSATVFALMPRSFKWLIMGGGLARSMGLFFALLMIYHGYLLFARRDRKSLLPTAAFAALAVLCHPEIAWLALFSMAVLFVCYCRSRATLVDCGVIVAAVLLFTAPWWGTVLAQHGTSPLLSAAGTGHQTWDAWLSFDAWGFTEQPVLNWPPILALLGAVLLVAQRRPFLLLWLVAIVLLEPRSAATYATVPMAMLIAECLAALLLPVWNSGSRATVVVGDAWLARLRLGVQPWLPRVAVALFLAYIVFFSARSATWRLGGLQALTADDRAAMAWVRDNTPETSTFLVVTGAPSASSDRASEWFPALTQRASLATPQGYEWLGKGEFDKQVIRFVALQRCAGLDATCLDKWTGATGVPYTHVYVTAACCKPLATSLRAAPQYRLVFESPAAAVFERTP